MKNDLHDILSFFPSVGQDASQISWSHATNSWQALKAAIDGDIMMLEADLLIGRSPVAVDDVIMAHPPETESDLTFRDFLETVLSCQRILGIKLDFKSMAAVEPCLRMLNKEADRLRGPVVVNADVLRGTTGGSVPLNPAQFLGLHRQLAPAALLSIGWTTGRVDSDGAVYTWQQVQEMRQLLTDFKVAHVTFPVRACHLHSSQEQLLWLCNDTAGSLTVWAGAADEPIDRRVLQAYRTELGAHRIFVDLPAGYVKD